jgi:hypothetical protein
MTHHYGRHSVDQWRRAVSRNLYIVLGVFLNISLIDAPLRLSAQDTTQRLSGSVDEKDVRLLEPGKPVKWELAGGQQHTYRIKLGAGQFLKAVVKQEGIDLAVDVSGPDGNRVFQSARPGW